MIKSIELTNFLTHKDTTIELSKGVNVLKGQTASGKSSIVKGLKWILENRPMSDSLKSHFAKVRDTTNVKLSLDDGEVTRSKNNLFNGYLIKGRELKAIRSDVPEEVTTLLNMNEINLHSQFDGFFLLQKSSGEVARLLNDFVGLSIIDESQRRVNSLISRSNADLARNTTEVEECNKLIEELECYQKIETKLNILDSFLSQYDGVASELDRLLGFEKQIEESERLLQADRTYLKQIEPQLESLNQTVEEYADAIVIAHTLFVMEGDITKANFNINKARKVLEQDGLLYETLELINKYMVVHSELLSMEDFYLQSGDCRATIKDQTAYLTKNEEAFNTLLKKAGKCPLCGQGVK